MASRWMFEARALALLLCATACGAGADAPARAVEALDRGDAGRAAARAVPDPYAAFSHISAADLAGAPPEPGIEPNALGGYAVLGARPPSRRDERLDRVLTRRASLLARLEPAIYRALDGVPSSERTERADRVAHRIVEEGLDAIDEESEPSADEDEARAARILREECGL